MNYAVGGEMNPELHYPEMHVEMNETVWSFFGTTPEVLIRTLKDKGCLDKAVRQFVAESGYVYQSYAMKLSLDADGNITILTRGVGDPIGEPVNVPQAGIA